MIKDMVERSLLAIWSIVLLLNSGPRKKERDLALGCLALLHAWELDVREWGISHEYREEKY